mmetsp:Transcript_3989/g.9272  ORF Transcript_3989/g.9272 Transcript_3989/m.9272 type:complete len:399 (-) Transcript_3989:75-1271(-)|eukprot:CAMPEP_0170599478 /NCGR_PEP_ID=MMETSP0224-20130122/16818_1 /TAXON_ID=285029 /ORGANISM="Togula jolla, Strain CCCM 725" /LENGTH=398 /DNA_ID=CAMNT_0010924131 /DNA_START=66 /DNA_END=1262 /DNA_ORIENTATION=+
MAAQRQRSAHGPSPGSAWLSFPALFSDGDHEPEDAESLPAREDSGPPEIQTPRSEASGLSAIRLDLTDMHEAIRNHDLWVQDAAAMRTDIDDLQAAIREHEQWMGQLSSALRQNQERELRLEGEMESLRRRLGGDAVVAVSPKGRARRDDEVAATSDGCGSDSDETEAVQAHQSRLDSGTDLEQIELGLTQQLSRGLRMIRAMVTAVEGGLARQLDGERNTRRTAVSELRQKLVQVDKHSFSDASTTSTSEFEKSALVVLQSHVEAIQQDTAQRFAEAESSIGELRAELMALRTEHQLQVVAAGALALSSSGISRPGRERSIQALDDRAAAVLKQQHVRPRLRAQLCDGPYEGVKTSKKAEIGENGNSTRPEEFGHKHRQLKDLMTNQYSAERDPKRI